MVAVGSNASPHVLLDKLGGVLREAPQEHIAVEVRHVPRLRVGHCARVSAGGYVAAAPFLPNLPSSLSPTPQNSPPEPSAFCIGWFTAAHLTALDATEPNYHRVRLATDVAPVEGAQVYVSAHGVIGEGGHALPLLSQRDLYSWLRARLPCLHTRGTAHPRPYADAGLRDQVNRELAELGLVVPSGLEPTPNAEARAGCPTPNG